MTHWLWLMLTLLATVSGQIPRSPCPQYFSYQPQNGRYIGHIRMPNVGSSVKLTVSVFSAYALEGNLQRTSNGKDYWLDFGQQNPLPVIDWIAVNGQRICFSGGGRPSYLYNHQAQFSASSFSSGSSSSWPEERYYSPLSSNSVDDIFTGYGDTGTEYADAENKIAIYEPGLRGYGHRGSDVGYGGLFTRPVERPLPERNPPVQWKPQPSLTPSVQRPPPQKKVTTVRPRARLPKRADRCGVRAKTVNPLVLRGVTTTKGEWPWLAALFLHDSNNISICGGSLVDHSHVVTAAHCVTTLMGPARRIDEMYITLGRYDLGVINEVGNQVSDIADIIIHENYDHATKSNDIALVELKTPVKYDKLVRPICLWPVNIQLKMLQSRDAVVVGWGLDEKGSRTAVPMKAPARIVSQETCNSVQRTAFSDAMSFCAGYLNGTGPCNGDSGGGLMLENPETDDDGRVITKYYLTGVVSLGEKGMDPNEACDLQNHYAVYTKVNEYLDWLRNYVDEDD